MKIIIETNSKIVKSMAKMLEDYADDYAHASYAKNIRELKLTIHKIMEDLNKIKNLK